MPVGWSVGAFAGAFRRARGCNWYRLRDKALCQYDCQIACSPIIITKTHAGSGGAKGLVGNEYQAT
jgi:hypothetical protein